MLKDERLMLTEIKRWNALLVAFLFLVSTLLLLRRLVYLSQAGGGEFQHADWLVNYSSGIVRRGISGELFLFISELSHVNPLILVSTVQAVLTVLIIAVLFAKGLSLRMPDVVVILLVSPALVLFWVNDSTAAYRKELLGLAAFLPLLFPRSSGSVGVATVVTLYGLSVFFHEANLFLVPGLSAALYFRLGKQKSIGPIAILWLISLAAAVFSVIYVSVPDTDAMCTRLLSAGLIDRLCGGIFPWLVDGFGGTTSAVKVIVLVRVNLAVVALMIALLLLSCLWIATRVLNGWFEWALFLVSAGTPFMLYPIATDWSRWLSMQVFVMTFLLLVLAETRKAINLPVHRATYVVVLSFSLLVGISHIAPEPIEGFVFQFVHAVGVVLG
ncbi:hypothetical protein CLV75_2505 [Ruegeria conchae]|uniref:Uncharacterized protein n=2 Tax=Ruegeria conchae TaxID=981384 RepID=A0A497ZK54_9RHOB|nr:hypothetical protein CLV75_2505 [Ruegeria conchae]